MPKAHYRMPALLVFGAVGHAADRSAVVFQHKHWDIACDNTRTCRAGGYSDEAADIGAVSVLFTRHAGPGQALGARLHLAESDKGVMRTVRMTIDQHDIGTVALDLKTWSGILSPTQTAALLAAVLRNGVIEWRAGSNSWRLSGAGAIAVLLKLDEFQGRLGTPRTLVAEGSQSDSNVLPALPAPVAMAAPISEQGPRPLTLPPGQRQ